METKMINGVKHHLHVRITGDPAYWHPVSRIEIPQWKAGGIGEVHQFRCD